MSVLHGFEQTRQRRIDELDAALHEYIHTASGARLCWLEREDENKSFCAAFRTLPFDDSGVFHILEHSVLCGSKHFPVKEPFVELMKGSLNTFLNALTFPDKTCYPVASRNGRDFLNLMRVYLDAVFFPSIHEKPEIFQQEGWHYELHDGILTRSGVVLNEMKGAFADADELLINAMSRALFPASPYRFVSGGDPEAIPNLTYEAFTAAHKRFYHPANSYLLLDGSIDQDESFALLDGYLSQFAAIDPDTQIMYFTNPKALVVAEDGTQMTITSDKGIVDRQKRTIEIKPPVKAETDKGDTLQTDGSVYYNMDTRMIKGGKVVMDRHDKTSLKADAFETDSSLTKVTLTGHAQVIKGE